MRNASLPGLRYNKEPPALQTRVVHYRCKHKPKHMPILGVRIVFISVSNLKAVFLLSSCAFKRFMFPSSTFTPLLTPSCPPTSYNKPVAPTPLAPQASQSPEQRWMSRGFMTSDLAALKLSLDQVTTHSFQLLTSLICNKYNCVCSIGLIICLGS